MNIDFENTILELNDDRNNFGFGRAISITIERNGDMRFPIENLRSHIPKITVLEEYNITHINIKNWINEYRIINQETDRNIECPINLDKINKGDKYCMCIQCKYNISYDAIYNYLLQNKYNFFQCPMCKTTWSNKTIYINSNSVDIKTI